MANDDQVTIDPQFFLPPGVKNVQYREDDGISTSDSSSPTEFSEFSDDGVSDNLSVDADDWTALTPETSDELPIPDSVTVVSQTVKAVTGGGYVVDIVVEIPDMLGIENFDVAVTKA